MFHSAQNTLISGGTFNVLANPAEEGREGLKLLHQKIAAGALHNSAERYDPPKCHPQTRLAVLNKIMEWIRDGQKLCFFMWLYGPAGAGKSAIAQTIAEICFKEGHLAASFFFSRNIPTRNNEILFVTTIVYQLAICIPEIRGRIGKILENDPLILSRSSGAQLHYLVLKPINEAAEDEHERQAIISRPRFVVIDGLDECGDSKSQKYILDILLTVVQQLAIPIFFLVASRPDPHIRDTFNKQPLSALALRIVLDDTYKPDADIRIFLDSRFKDVVGKHPTLLRRSPPWPSELDLQLLVQKSSGQFIYASTVMKYLDSYHHWPPDRLDIVFGLSTVGDDTPLAELDLFYHHIFSSIVHLNKVIDVFVVLLLVQFWEKTRHLVEDFLFIRRGELDTILNDLHSLVLIPSTEDATSEIRFYHASLPDFLLDRSRSGKFFIDTTQASTRIMRQVMKHFKRPHNMCQDELNHHHLRSLFMLHCVNSNPTPELLDDLYDIDLPAQLSFWASDDNVIGMYEHDSKRIITFLMWLQNTQQHPLHEQSLWAHHQPAIDQWIYDQLESYPHQFTLKLLLAAGTFTNFLAPEVFTILGPTSVASGSQKRRRHDPLQIYFPKEEYASFYRTLSQFIDNPMQSGNYFIRGSTYATLSIFVTVSFMHTRNDTKVQKIASDLLAFALPRSAKIPELVKVLRTQMAASMSVIDHYLEECHKMEDPKGLALLIAYEKLKAEKDLPLDAYIVWMPINDELDPSDDFEEDYSVVFR